MEAAVERGNPVTEVGELINWAGLGVLTLLGRIWPETMEDLRWPKKDLKTYFYERREGELVEVDREGKSLETGSGS